MKQNDGAGMNASGQLFESLIVGWLLILVPVYIGKTPENLSRFDEDADEREDASLEQDLDAGCLIVGWLLILVPVYIGKTPEKRLVSEVLCHLQVLCAVFSLRRPVKFHHFLAGGFLIKCGDSVQFF